MTLRLVALLLNRPPSVVWGAAQRLGLKPRRVGTSYCLTWEEIEQLEAHLATRGRRRHG